MKFPYISFNQRVKPRGDQSVSPPCWDTSCTPMEPRTQWSHSNAELRRQSMQLSWHQSPPQACDISLCTVNHLGFKNKTLQRTPIQSKVGSAFNIFPHRAPQDCKGSSNKSNAKHPTKTKNLNSTGTFHATSHRGAMAVCCLLRVPNWPSPTGLQPAPKTHLAMCQRPGTCGALAVPGRMALGATDWELLTRFLAGPLPHPCFRSWSSGCKGQDLDHLSHLKVEIFSERYFHVCDGLLGFTCWRGCPKEFAALNCLFASMICMFEAANTASYAEICSYRNCRSIGMNFQLSKTGTSS